jgi:hypothetical protein
MFQTNHIFHWYAFINTCTHLLGSHNFYDFGSCPSALVIAHLLLATWLVQ